MGNIKVSIIIPVYNVEKYIKKCLLSVINQTFCDYEIIIVNDGCEDTSVQISEKILKNNNVIWRVVNQKNQGQGTARDNGIKLARGKYVICIDSDDIIHPQLIEILYKQAESANSQIVFSGYKVISKNKDIEIKKHIDKLDFKIINQAEMMERFLYRTLIPILPAMLINKELITKNKICTLNGCRFSEDVYFMWKLFCYSEGISYTQKKLYYYKIHSGSTMTSSSKDRILTGYVSMKYLVKDIAFKHSFEKSNYILPRWVLGASKSAVSVLKYKDFKELIKSMNYYYLMKQMKGFQEKKARLLAFLLYHSPLAFYCLLKIV